MGKLLVSVLLFMLLVFETKCSPAKHWVLIVAGANTYDNYWSQSTSCHAYHSVLNKGVPAENIIHMSYDDCARNGWNPFQNNLVWYPNGTNIYKGCKIDYTKEEVKPELFLKVLQGDKAGVRDILGRDGPVIESGPDDNIFITMVDHGGPGIFYFPNLVPLHAADLNQAFKKMHSSKRYHQMAVYMESCYSGSMFHNLLSDNINIYGSSNANPYESGYFCCYDEIRDAYVGTYYANAWEPDTDKSDVRKRTLNQQFTVMKASYNLSHAMQYGDLSIAREVLGEFQASVKGGRQSGHPEEHTDVHNNMQFGSEPSRRLEFAGIDLINPPMDMSAIAIRARRLLEPHGVNQKKLSVVKEELNTLMKIKQAAEGFVRQIAVRVMATEDVDDVITEKDTPANSVCYKRALRVLDSACPGLHFGKFPFIRSYLNTVVNLCNRRSYQEVVDGIVAAARKQSTC